MYGSCRQRHVDRFLSSPHAKFTVGGSGGAAHRGGAACQSHPGFVLEVQNRRFWTRNPVQELSDPLVFQDLRVSASSVALGLMGIPNLRDAAGDALSADAASAAGLIEIERAVLVHLRGDGGEDALPVRFHDGLVLTSSVNRW